MIDDHPDHTPWEGIAWAVALPAAQDLRLFLNWRSAAVYCAKYTNARLIDLTNSRPSHAPGALAWATVLINGCSPMLHLDRATAEATAARYHRRVVELYDAAQPVTTRQPARMPQGELTPGGVMRL